MLCVLSLACATVQTVVTRASSVVCNIQRCDFPAMAASRLPSYSMQMLVRVPTITHALSAPSQAGFPKPGETRCTPCSCRSEPKQSTGSGGSCIISATAAGDWHGQRSKQIAPCLKLQSRPSPKQLTVRGLQRRASLLRCRCLRLHLQNEPTTGGRAACGECCDAA